MSLYGLGLRASFKISDTIRDRGLQAPKDIVRFDNLPYGTDPRWQTLDVYRPKNAGGTALPVIVSVHGGGWVYGDKNLYQYYCMSLAQHGFAVVNFSYRLAPRHKFPAALQDTDAVFHWVMATRWIIILILAMFSPWPIRPGLTFWGCTQRGALTRQLQIFRLPRRPALCRRPLR